MRALFAIVLSSLVVPFARGAALVPVPTPKAPLPVAGLEVNQGQAKPEILFLVRGNLPMAVMARAVLFSPSGVRQTFAGGNPDAEVRYTDPLAGVANAFTGSESSKWVKGIKRYATARVVEVYPGIDVEYALDVDGQLTARLLVKPGADLSAVTFDVEGGGGGGLSLGGDGTLTIPLSGTKGPRLIYQPLVAIEATSTGAVPRSAQFQVLSTTRFVLRVDGATGRALTIEMKIPTTGNPLAGNPHFVADSSGNIFAVATIADSAGKDARFTGAVPPIPAEACDSDIGYPYACADVAIYNFLPSGELTYISYLAGRTAEEPSFLGLAANGDLVVTGNTDSSDFPVTAGAYQTLYGGPAAIPSQRGPQGDFFAVRFDPATGVPRAATYFGGPRIDRVGATELGADGSLYFLPQSFRTSSVGMPVMSGALQAACNDPCSNGYAAHLDAGLGTLLYGTYLPGNVTTGRLHSDGSVYYAGSGGAGFPTTPGAYKQQVSGEVDAIVGRLNPAGTQLMFATYIGGPANEAIFEMAVGPDGTVWAGLNSDGQRLVHLDALGTRILGERAISVGDVVTDRDGNVLVLTSAPISPSAGALILNSCGTYGSAYLRLDPSGQQLFGTYLPAIPYNGFEDWGAHGSPILTLDGHRVELVEGPSMGVYAGCMLDAAQYTPQAVPGGIVSLFGSQLGPPNGVAFQLVNGRVPTALGGTRVLVNGEAVPILYASAGQVNAILPFSLTPGRQPEIRVEWNGSMGNALINATAQSQAVTLFQTSQVTVDGHAYGMAAALNEDGTVNSTANPAKKGSRVVLFGTGGGVTSPSSADGEVTPQARTLVAKAMVSILQGFGIPLVVEYAGAAPSLVAGVTQINIKLPDVLSQTAGMPAGLLPIRVATPLGTPNVDFSFIAVEQ